MSNFSMTFNGTSEQLENPEVLKSLSQKEAARFEEYLRASDKWFRDGLSKFELDVIAGYVYRKVVGHLDAYHDQATK